jgi:carbonic anhydrase
MARNKEFAETQFDPELRMKPSLSTIVVGCLDPRVDPAVILGLDHGDIACIRNVGGRVTPHEVMEITMLRNLAQINGGDINSEWKIIVLQHTDCGIVIMHDHRPSLLPPYFEIEEQHISEKSVTDPRAAVALDVAALRAEASLADIPSSGLVYDVATGRIEIVA